MSKVRVRYNIVVTDFVDVDVSPTTEVGRVYEEALDVIEGKGYINTVVNLALEDQLRERVKVQLENIEEVE